MLMQFLILVLFHDLVFEPVSVFVAPCYFDVVVTQKLQNIAVTAARGQTEGFPDHFCVKRFLIVRQKPAFEPLKKLSHGP